MEVRKIHFAEEVEGDVVILYLKGKIFEEEGKKFLNQAREIIDKGYRKIVIDFSDVKHMNTDGLGKLLAAREYIVDKQGELKISGAELKLESLLKMTKTITFFKCYKTAGEAVESFSKDKEVNDEY